MNRATFGLCLTLLLAGTGFADQITLKNGDRISGNIEKLEKGKLTVKTDYADEITIKWDSVAKLSSDTSLYVMSGQEKIAAKSLDKTDTQEVVVASNGERRLTDADVSNVRSEASQSEYEKSLHPSLIQGWAGGANLGFALTRGNAQNTNLSTGLNLDRRTLNDEITLYAASVYTNDQRLSVVSANAINGGARYDRNITSRLFGFGSADFQYDELQALDLGSIIGGGLGLHVIKQDTTIFDVMGGLAWSRLRYSTGLLQSYTAAQFGEEFTCRLFEGTDLKERGFIYPDVTAFGTYRASLDVGLSTKIAGRLAWQNTLSDRYVTNPLPGKVSNDLLFSTGVAFTVGPKKKK